MYRAVTRGIQITVRPRFMRRNPRLQARYFWAYTVEIANLGGETVQLTMRHWQITDGEGAPAGGARAGVVGEEPVIEPGHSFTYTSGCPLATPDGMMSGTYTMETAQARRFEVEIPLFPLDSPYVHRVVH